MELDLELTPQKLASIWYSYGVKTLDGSSWQNV